MVKILKFIPDKTDVRNKESKISQEEKKASGIVTPLSFKMNLEETAQRVSELVDKAVELCYEGDYRGALESVVYASYTAGAFNNVDKWGMFVVSYPELVGKMLHTESIGYAYQGEWQYAKEATTVAIYSDSSNPMYYYSLANLLIGQNLMRKANSVLLAMEKFFPGHTATYLLGGDLNFFQGKTDDAEALYHKSLAEDNENYVAHGRLSSIYHGRGNAKKAKAHENTMNKILKRASVEKLG